jgi:hypothetical protein
VQVVVEQAGQRRPPLVLAVLGGGELAGVVAQQVVQAMPARSGGLDQVRAKTCKGPRLADRIVPS